MPTLGLLPKGPQASLRLCCVNRAASLHSPGPMLGWMSLRGEAGDSLSETSSSSLTEDKTLVLAGGPAGENPLRAFPDTRLLQGDTATPSRLWIHSSICQEKGAPGLCPEDYRYPLRRLCFKGDRTAVKAHVSQCQ